MLKIYSHVSFWILIGFISFISLYFLKESLPFWFEFGPIPLFQTEWFPSDSQYGFLTMIIVSLIVTFLSGFICIILALCCSLMMSEILPQPIHMFIKIVAELMSGIPGVIYGLFGLSILSPIIQNFFHTPSGNNILTASLLLSFLTLPMLITLYDDAFQDVPQKFRTQAKSIGLNNTEISFYVVLPFAFRSLTSSSLLALSRAIGETIAVMLVIGSIDSLPSPLYNILDPSQTVTSKLGREAAEAINNPEHWSALMALGVTLITIVVSFMWLSFRLKSLFKRKRRVFAKN